MTSPPHSRRILRNVAYGFSTWIVPLFLGLFVTRVLVAQLGHVDYGIYALVIGFIAYSFNFSIGRAITKYLASYRAAGDDEKVRKVISTTTLLTFVVALTGFFLILLLSRWLVVDVFGIEFDSQAEAITALRISSATILAVMLGQTATAVIQGLHRFDIYSKMQNLGSIVMMLGNLVLAYSGYGLVTLLYWNLAATVFLTLLAFLVARRLLPQFRLRLDVDRETFGLVLRYSAGVVGYQIVANAFFLFERSWIMARMGPEQLTFYVVPLTVGIYFHGFVGSLMLVLFPLASELERDPERLLVLYRTATKAVLFITVIIATTLIVDGRSFLTLWMGPEFGERSSLLLTMHTVAFGLTALSIVSFQTAEGLGKPGFNFRNAALGIVVAVPLIIVLTERLGPVGVAFGRILAFAVPFAAIVDLERRRLGGFQRRFWSGNVLRFGAAALAAASVEYVLITGLSLGWVGLLVSAAAGFVAYMAILYVTGILSENDRRLLRRLVRNEA